MDTGPGGEVSHIWRVGRWSALVAACAVIGGEARPFRVLIPVLLLVVIWLLGGMPS